MIEPTHFPTRLFRWFVSRQILLALGLILIFNCSLLIWIEWRQDLSPELRSIARQILFFGGLGSTLILILVSFFMARRLVKPLGRLIEKSRRLRETPFEPEELKDVQLAYDEPGEWYELERALNQLGQVLRQKTIRLSREKTELRTIMSGLDEAVLAVDLDYKVLFYNPQFALMFETVDSIAERRIGEVIRSPDVIAAYKECLGSGATVRKDISITAFTNRLPRDFELSVAPLRKKHNQEIYGVVGVFHDITEMKQTERIRIEFVGNVSHELRTPLTTIHGYVQTLVQDVAAKRFDQAGEFLAIVSQSVQRLKSLVEDLLDLSNLESGQELQIEWVNTNEVTESVIAQVNSADHKISMSYQADKVFADAKRLEQVVRNLVENAVRYVPKGKDIDVRWSNSGGSVKLSVKDNGPGIEKKHQSRLFERFYRVDEGRARSDGGTGIGLSLVKHIMQRHGGAVSVHSEPGRGAEFVCVFPLPK
jgi:two-component system phosphate regulon sensor histidine kinase PhoR